MPEERRDRLVVFALVAEAHQTSNVNRVKVNERRPNVKGPSFPNLSASTRKPFDVDLQGAFRKLRRNRMLLRVQEAKTFRQPHLLKGQPKPLVAAHQAGAAAHLPLPWAVRPPVTS
jgi:hypothetical protein